MQKLNSLGIGHLLAIMLIVVATGLTGSFLLFKSHADPARVSCQKFGQGKYRHCATPRENDAAITAKWILKSKYIGYYSKAAKKDLKTVAARKYITKETCGHAVIIDPRILDALYNSSSLYTIKVDNFVTGRGGCDKKGHPKGRAIDIGYAKNRHTGKHSNFLKGDRGNNNKVNREFIRYFSSYLPAGSNVGQMNCKGRKTTLPAGVHPFKDTCDHQHFDIGGY